MATVHTVPEDESHPLQLTKVEPELGVAVRVTPVPTGKLIQLAPQFKPETEEVMPIVPLPVPEVAVVRVTCCGAALNVAVMMSSPFTVRLQGLVVPAQAPDMLPQPANVD